MFELLSSAFNIIIKEISYFSYSASVILSTHILASLSLILCLGIFSQWLAWRFYLPSILILLITGCLAGPVFGIIKPDEIFGNMLLPAVSISVAIILFEGGLNLNSKELKHIGRAVRNLITSGALVSWIIITAGAYYILKLSLALSALLGTILIVTGPTVIMPLLRHIKPSAKVGSILKWEGIVIDPIGAIFAVLVFKAIIIGTFQSAMSVILIKLLKIILTGFIFGYSGAKFIVYTFKNFIIPDYLQVSVSLATVVGLFTLSNTLNEESGLLTVTIMGIVIASQENFHFKHILEFKENLRVLLISCLFIVLAARLNYSDLTNLDIKSLLFILFIIFVARPATVFISNMNNDLTLNEKIFISFMAPRGIIAASVASIFSQRLTEAGYSEAKSIVPITFAVIIGTVLFYGLLSPVIASFLKIANPDPQGTLIVGANKISRHIAKILVQHECQVLLSDTNQVNIATAIKEGFSVHHGSILSSDILESVQLNEFCRLIALTSNDELNSFAAIRFADIFGRNQVFQLNPHSEANIVKHLTGRTLFGTDYNYTHLSDMIENGAQIVKKEITSNVSPDELICKEDNSINLFLVTPKKRVFFMTGDIKNDLELLKPGCFLYVLVNKTRS